MKKIISFVLAAVLFLSAAGISYAESPVDTASRVTQAMCSASYWKKRASSDPSALLMTPRQIREYNRVAIASPGAMMFDLAALGKENYSVTEESRAKRAQDIVTRDRDLYIHGEKIDNESYFAAIRQAILDTSHVGSVRRSELAVAVRYTALRSFPTLDEIGYSADDPDSEFQLSALVVNEPFVIRQTAIVNGVRFYFGYTTNLCGWVRADDLALFGRYENWLDENGTLDEAKFHQDYDAWLSAWDFDSDSNDFLVVTQDKLILDSSYSSPETSDVRLTLSTALRLVPDDEKPEALGERGTWNNYVVYLPTRDADGQCVETMALIPQHCSVSIGYLPYTQSNVLDLAFSCLGNRYGWSGMLNSYDCSLYVRTIYRCFGFEMPRNTTTQRNVKNSEVLSTIDLVGLIDEEKAQLISSLPIGSILYLNGHTMLYVGTVNDELYVISAAGSVADAGASFAMKTQYSVVLTPLSCRRRNGQTWLHELTTAVAVQ